ncbi:MAG: xylose isomerase [Bacteroidetes bacterium]|nr:MAG: xylose isomerase [Bacteroidota bacterium]
MKSQKNSKNIAFLLILVFVAFAACKSNAKKEELPLNENQMSTNNSQFFKLSLAQWSMHRMIMDKTVSPFDFAKKAKEWGFEGIEYVSQLFADELAKYVDETEGMKVLVARLKEESEKAGVENLLIMVDSEGDLANSEEAIRDEAVENHKKWVDAAYELGCHSIRVNLPGAENSNIWIESAIYGLTKLLEYATPKNINIIVENHGGLSSNTPYLMKVINAIGKSNCGTLPDFGNFCITRKEGTDGCFEEYPDKYEGVKLMMPSAKAVSAKSYDFDENGNEIGIDYYKMLTIVKDAGYQGYIGVEYEGENLSEEQGIIATRNLLVQVAKKLN